MAAKGGEWDETAVPCAPMLIPQVLIKSDNDKRATLNNYKKRFINRIKKHITFNANGDMCQF